MKFLKIVLVLTPLLFFSCMGKEGSGKFDQFDIAEPVRLTHDTTVVVIKDYFTLIGKIDSVKSSTLKIYKYDSFDTIKIIKNKESKTLNFLTISSEGSKGTIAVIDYDFYSVNDTSSVIAVSKEYKNGRVIAEIYAKDPDYIVMWQNSIIDPFHIELKKSKSEFSSKIQLNIEIPTRAKEFERSFLRIFTSGGESLGNDIIIPLRYGEVIDSSVNLKREDKHAQIIYSLMIDRFYDGNQKNTKRLNNSDVLSKVDYYGGDLEGILEKIKSGFFNNIGINTIWLSPITQNPYDAWGQFTDPLTKFSGYHGYWPIYLTKIDERFGNDDVLRELLSEAHSRDINVILDYVANHMHINSPTLKEHPDWTTSPVTPDGRPNFELWDEFRLTTWFDKHIPSLDLEKEYVYEPMTDSALYWMTNFDFDGFRHDATKHIPEVFWRRLTQKIKTSLPNKSIYQIGETYGSPSLISSYVRNGMLDGQFDFNVYDSFIWSVINKDGSFRNVQKTLKESLNTYGYHNLMGYITGNHDRPRFISLAGGAVTPDEDWKRAGWKRDIGVGSKDSYDYLSILHAFIMTIPGIPTVYYGDEYGDPGANDPDNRRWMRFDNYNQNENLVLENFIKLSRFRRSSMPLLYGDFIPLSTDDDIISFMRVYMGKIVIVAINKGNENRTLELKLPIDIGLSTLQTRSGKLVQSSSNELTIEVESKNYTLINN